MKVSVSVGQVQAVLDERLYTELWDEANGQTKIKAVAHACRDIGSLSFDSLAVPEDAIIGAVAEQALFLLELTLADRRRVQAQNIGVKQRGVDQASEWYHDGKPGKLFSPDALNCLSGYLHRKFGGIR